MCKNERKAGYASVSKESKGTEKKYSPGSARN